MCFLLAGWAFRTEAGEHWIDFVSLSEMAVAGAVCSFADRTDWVAQTDLKPLLNFYMLTYYCQIHYFRKRLLRSAMQSYASIRDTSYQADGLDRETDYSGSLELPL